MPEMRMGVGKLTVHSEWINSCIVRNNIVCLQNSVSHMTLHDLGVLTW